MLNVEKVFVDIIVQHSRDIRVRIINEELKWFLNFQTDAFL